MVGQLRRGRRIADWSFKGPPATPVEPLYYRGEFTSSLHGEGCYIDTRLGRKPVHFDGPRGAWEGPFSVPLPGGD